MTINFGALFGYVRPIDVEARASDIWRNIQRRSSTITIARPEVVHGDGTTTPAAPVVQVVRIESDNRASDVKGVAGAAPIRQAIIFGVKGHPDPDVTDTDLDEGDEFDVDDDHYRIVDLIQVPGGIQGIAMVNG